MPRNKQRWNHTIHYHDFLLAHAPRVRSTALDVGCGDGTLTRRLSTEFQTVTGLDADGPSLARAQRLCRDRPGVTLLQADFLTHHFVEKYDFVVTTAVLHHLPLEPALRKLAGCVKPGGTLAILGLARSNLPGDFARDALGLFYSRWLRRNRVPWEHCSPIAAPRDSYGRIRKTTARLLKNRLYRRHLLWRYSVIWRTRQAST